LREQARSLGIDDHRWHEVAHAYAEVNEMFGDIIKVTPTSKTVGDMAIMMVTSGLTRAAVLDPKTEIAFPESVVQFFHGDSGSRSAAFPAALQLKVLGGKQPLEQRPGELMPPADLERSAVPRGQGRTCDQRFRARFVSDVSESLRSTMPPTARNSAMWHPCQPRCSSSACNPGQEINIDLERGKTLIVRYVTTSDAHEDGTRTVFFELNGQPRPIRVADRSQVAKRPPQRKAEAGNLAHVGAPMPGSVVPPCPFMSGNRCAAATSC
jgi:pyruvate carboxylase